MPGQPSEFFVGVNLPWIQYGCDFGANAWQPGGGIAQPDRRARVCDVFDRLAGAGLTTVRWFMLCDGRAGIRFDGQGRAAGLDTHLFRDLDAALDVAARRGLALVFVLFDFSWWRRARTTEGVRMGGHRRETVDPAHPARSALECGAKER